MAEKRRPPGKNIFRIFKASSVPGAIFSFVFVPVVLITILFVFSVYLGLFGRLHSKEELLGFKNATASLVLSDEGRIIGRFFSENRTNISFRQIPPHLVDALIATEDIRFYQHKGIDTRSLARVIIKTVLFNDPGSGGGSTISQQLAKNLFGRKNYGLLTVPVNKTKEIFLAYRIENVFSKEDILTIYLNTVSFGENVYGAEAASRRYFNKKIEDLEIGEAAVLIGMLKANTLYNPRLFPENSRSRRNVIFRQMEKYNFLEPAVSDSLCKLPLALNYSNLESQNPAGYFLVRVRKEAEDILRVIDSLTGKKWNIEEDGLVINTSLNLDLQNSGIKAFKDHLPKMQKRLNDQYLTWSGEKILEGIASSELNRLKLTARATDTVFLRSFSWEGSYSESITVMDSIKQALLLLHGGLLAIDPASGAIRAWIGGIDYLSQPYDQIMARRQLASAFKPFIYAVALEQGIEPCQYFDNDSIVMVDYNDWTPANYDHKYGGKYNLTQALALSLNVPTFNLFLNLDFRNISSLWTRMGFSYPIHYAPSLALGTAEANILETATGYAAFANGGYKVSPFSIESIHTHDGEVIYKKPLHGEQTRVLSERSSLLMRAMLQKAIDEGTGVSLRNVFGVSMPLGGKTGTSQNYADAWFAACNPGMVIVSRVGASSPAIHFNSGAYGSGSALALPLVALTLRNVQENKELMDKFITPFPELPPELKRALDCFELEERTVFDRLLDLFKKDEGIQELKEKKEPETMKPSFLRRLFRRNN
jgi:penicillin-binding protein 1A